MTKGRKCQIELFIVSESLNNDEHFYLALISKALFKENMGQLKKDTKRQGVLVNNSRPKDKGDASSFFCQKKKSAFFISQRAKRIYVHPFVANCFAVVGHFRSIHVRHFYQLLFKVNNYFHVKMTDVLFCRFFFLQGFFFYQNLFRTEFI